jgi:hypothetical protein
MADDKHGGWLASLKDEARSQITSASLQFAWPWILAAMVPLSGLLNPSIPFPYLLTATIVSFAGIMVGAFYFRQYVFQQNPEGKFQLASFGLGKRYEDREGKKELVGLKYMIMHQNSAMFEMDWEIIPRQVSLGASINPKPNRDISGGRSPGGAVGMFSEAEVPRTDAMRGQVVEGQWEFDVAYGRPNRRRYTIRKKFRINIKFDVNGEVESAEPTEVPTILPNVRIGIQ